LLCSRRSQRRVALPSVHGYCISPASATEAGRATELRSATNSFAQRSAPTRSTPNPLALRLSEESCAASLVAANLET